MQIFKVIAKQKYQIGQPSARHFWNQLKKRRGVYCLFIKDIWAPKEVIQEIKLEIEGK